MYTPSQAMETKDTLVDQRGLVLSSSSTLGIIATRFPVLNKLMGAIHHRKTRENVILGLVISFCICFALWYVLGGTSGAV
jgi:hypothetical protein